MLLAVQFLYGTNQPSGIDLSLFKFVNLSIAFLFCT